jgi:hypothetical protein
VKGIDKKLFPEDGEWLKGSFSDLREMFGSFEYFAKYIRKRFPNAKESEIEGVRAAFLIEGVEVHWKAVSELERVRVHVGYGSSTIKIFVPDLTGYTTADRQRIEGEYHDRYMSRIKESHIRMNALLWFLLSDAKKTEIAEHFPEEIDPTELNLFGSEKK